MDIVYKNELLSHRNRLKVPTEESWHASKLLLHFGVIGGIAVNPVEESIHMELIISDVFFN
jgi:hypothetical protein